MNSMNMLIGAAKRVAVSQSGAATVEYGLLTIGVVGAVTGAAVAFKTQITTLFTSIGTTLTAATTTAKGT